MAARADKKLIPLRTPLTSGQTIEIVTAPSAAPSPQWLDWVVSGRARTAIRHHLKRLQHEDAVEFGHRMLDRGFTALGSSLETIPTAVLERYLTEQKYKRFEELLADIALGNRVAETEAQALLLAHGDHPHAARVASGEKILISGSERGVLTFANCCHPAPGDEIMGYLSAGKGIVVHRLECPNVPELRKSPERCIEMGWAADVRGDYRIELRIDVANKPGVLAQVAAGIAEASSNIENVEYKERDTETATLLFTIEIRNRKHLADVIRHVRRLHVVNTVRRYPL